ncbi:MULTISPECIES: Na+/H+ antiporter subunit E [Streptomyces]|uniref:Cation transporter n=2 Tax=Streptomyces TaxID=1883 RepID=A0A3M8F7Q6_9ACTN|nr:MULTISPECIES: Na+/H+ antiporter subunit E [Streptomyces]KNE79094.1 hypothetical protein ADZ36_29410 [Streptomyces fradiae]OFA36569.1 hypothetical protein BEN35_29965 [Streptomyces fradiae]PQM22374.1 cation transporter [Streptomyces xinghaiensis]RKM96659.1 cation transporter [Streptomyces xinghaiensis]RNC74189.1 cation transporter [Streptomyces xinghaiensis]
MTGRLAARLRHAALRTVRTVAFLGYFSRVFLLANLTVAREIVTPGSGIAPAVLKLPLRSRTPLEIASIAHLIVLTPGTLVLEVRTTPPTLFVHGMHASDPGRFLDRLRDMESRLLRVMRPAGEGNP